MVNRRSVIICFLVMPIFSLLGSGLLAQLNLDFCPIELGDESIQAPTPEVGALSSDANGEGVVTISDAVFLSNYVFYDGSEPDPSASGNPNEDCVMDIQDIVSLIDYLFHGGQAPLRGWEID